MWECVCVLACDRSNKLWETADIHILCSISAELKFIQTTLWGEGRAVGRIKQISVIHIIGWTTLPPSLPHYHFARSSCICWPPEPLAPVPPWDWHLSRSVMGLCEAAPASGGEQGEGINVSTRTVCVCVHENTPLTSATSISNDAETQPFTLLSPPWVGLSWWVTVFYYIGRSPHWVLEDSQSAYTDRYDSTHTTRWGWWGWHPGERCLSHKEMCGSNGFLAVFLLLSRIFFFLHYFYILECRLHLQLMFCVSTLPQSLD